MGPPGSEMGMNMPSVHRDRIRLGVVYSLYGRRAGGELLVERTLAGLLDQCDDLDVTAFCNREAAGALPADTARFRKVAVGSLDNQISKAWWLEFGSRRAIASLPLDVVWITSGANGFPGPWRVPAVVTFCDLGEFYMRGKYDRLRELYRKRVCHTLSVRRARAITTISQRTADDVTKFLHPACPVVTIHPGPSPRRLTLGCPNPREIIRRETSLELDRIFFTPARTDYLGKGLDVLLDAYGRFLEQTGGAPPLVVAGPRGMDHARFEREMRTGRLAGRVYWAGRVSDECIDALYQISEAVVYPSRYEGFGFPALEAMLHGVPVICSDAGSLPEVVGPAALHFASGSSDELLEGLVRLHGDRRLREELISKGREQVKLFTWEACVAQMYDVFRETAVSATTRKPGSP